MSIEVPVRTDRRQLRRAETIEELVDVAVQVMSEQGAGGLSLGEVARRMGIRPPSLYVYFDSKNAVYDAVFARGWQQVHEAMLEVPEPNRATDLAAYLHASAESFVRWCLDHPVHAQLMVWRPVPGYQPSAEAYQPAVAVLGLTRSRMGELQGLGLLRRDVAIEEVVNAWTLLISGVISQQLANAPHQSFDVGSFTRLLPALVAMFTAHYAPLPSRAPIAKKRGKS